MGGNIYSGNKGSLLNNQTHFLNVLTNGWSDHPEMMVNKPSVDSKANSPMDQPHTKQPPKDVNQMDLHDLNRLPDHLHDWIVFGFVFLL